MRIGSLRCNACVANDMEKDSVEVNYAQVNRPKSLIREFVI